MQGIPNYIPATNHVSTLYTIAAVLYLQSELHVMLFRPWNMSCTFPFALPAVPNMAVCLQLLNFVLSRHVALVLCEWFWNGPSRPYHYRYPFCFHIPQALNFYYEVFIFWNLLSNIIIIIIIRTDSKKGILLVIPCIHLYLIY